MLAVFRRPIWRWLVPTWLFLAWLNKGLLAGEGFLKNEMALVFYPLKRYLAQCLAGGHWPAWWPFDGLGQPMSSLPIASLLHPTVLLYFLPLHLAFTLQTLLPTFLAPIGMWLLARTVGLRRPAAALATLAMGVSFWHVLLSQQAQMHLAAASLPWFWREAIRLHRSRRGSPVLLALAAANLVVGGDPMLLELSAIGLAPLLVRWPLRPRALARVVGAGLLGLGLAAVQLAPMIFLFDQSPRASGLNLSTDDLFALRWNHLQELIWPVYRPSEPLFQTVYVGVPVLALAAVGLSRRWRYRWPLLIVLVTFGLTAVGRAGPLWALWSGLLPGWNALQFPLKALGPAVVPLALLAGRGFQLAARRWAFAAMVLGGLVLVALGVWTAALGTVAGLLGWLGERKPELASVVAGLVLLCVGADLAAQLQPLHTMPFEVIETAPPLTEALLRHGVSTSGGFYEWSYDVPPDMDRRFPGWRDRESELMLLVVAPEAGALFGLPTSQQYLAGITRRVFDLSLSSKEQNYRWRASLSQAFGATARVQLLVPQPLAVTLAEDRELGAMVVALPAGLPRAYVAFAATPVEDERQVARLSSPEFRPGLEVLLAPKDVGRLPPGPGNSRPPQPVTITRDPDRIHAQLTVDQPGLLVINEALARGWSATLDGAPAELIYANHAVMGLHLEPGPHRVELEYHTPGLPLGIGLCALSALALLGWTFARRRVARFA